MSNEELIKHKIEVDEYITMDILIPKVMNALQFKGLTMKANKLFNLSETTNILPLHNNATKKGNRWMTKKQQIFLLRKFYVKDVKLVVILDIFRKKFPETQKNDESIIRAIYNQKKRNTPLYQKIMKEKEKVEENKNVE